MFSCFKLSPIQGLPWVALTYGFISALGQGIALIPTMTIGMRWFPQHKGLAMGVVVGGFGGGAFIFNQIQTAILNPGNLSTEGEYFEDPALLARVPGLLLTLAGLYLSLQVTQSVSPSTCVSSWWLAAWSPSPGWTGNSCLRGRRRLTPRRY